MNSFGWTNEEDKNLVELIKPNSHLYNILDPSRKNILARETTWQKIAQVISKPVEECKKRWRGLKDNYTRSKKIGAQCNMQEDLIDKLQFLDSYVVETESNDDEQGILFKEDMIMQQDDEQPREEHVITDKQEYYEITLVDGTGATNNQDTTAQVINFIPSGIQKKIPLKRGRKPGIKRKVVPVPNIAPVKILPKPIILNNHKVINYIEEEKPITQVNNTSRSNSIDKLIEKILKENTNEIDVFFRSMAASVKKLQPNLIPKVKMEVCNVIAKYEMQSFDKNGTNF